jgi:hypothetical protein
METHGRSVRFAGGTLGRGHHICAFFNSIDEQHRVLNVQEAIGTGQLEMPPWQDGPLHGGRFDQDTWVASFEQVRRSGPAAEYAQARFLAQKEWALVELPGVEDLIEFETRADYVVPKYDDAMICRNLAHAW